MTEKETYDDVSMMRYEDGKKVPYYKEVSTCEDNVLCGSDSDRERESGMQAF
jgi:hypothetical protein